MIRGQRHEHAEVYSDTWLGVEGPSIVCLADSYSSTIRAFHRPVRYNILFGQYLNISSNMGLYYRIYSKRCYNGNRCHGIRPWQQPLPWIGLKSNATGSVDVRTASWRCELVPRVSASVLMIFCVVHVNVGETPVTCSQEFWFGA